MLKHRISAFWTEQSVQLFFLHELKLISLYIAWVALVPKCLFKLLNGASCLVTQTKWLLLVMYMYLYALRMHCPKVQMMQRRNRDRMICWVERKGSHHFCIIGVRLRFLYCLMCEPQPAAPQQCVVDVLYTTYLTRPVGGKRAFMTQTSADRNTGPTSCWCTLIDAFEVHVTLTCGH